MKKNNGDLSFDNEKKRGLATKITAVILCVLLIATNVLLYIFEGHVNLYLGRGEMVIEKAEGSENWDSTYYKPDYQDKGSLVSAAEQMVEQISNEGFVLMKNNGALPLQPKAKVTLLGRNAADPVYGGSGSGSVSLDTVVDMKAGLENAQFDINETVYNILADYASFKTELSETGKQTRKYKNPRANIVMDSMINSSYYIGEMPVENYTEQAISSFTTYNDAAIISIGRGGGEGGDLTQDMTDWDKNYLDGQHQLELNYDEKQTIELAKKHFETVIVIINSSTVMELGTLESDEGVDSIVWVGSPGQTGFNSLGHILDGSVNPSGKTADIYPRDLTKDPTFVNFGHNKYSNIDINNAIGDGFYVQYEEGIYVGYRYYETAAKEGFIDYEKSVVYPFGHGLSYTDFSWEIVSQEFGEADGDITVNVKVTNTGTTHKGKEVVQMYYSPPYNKGGIEKSEIVLADFAKTGLLAPGESETVTLSFAVEEMASYDYKNNKAYVLEEGDYGIRIQNNSHQSKEGTSELTYTVKKTITYGEGNLRGSDKTQVTNQFDDVNAYFTDTAVPGKITNMSRSDFSGTFPTAPMGADKVADEAIIEGFQAYVASEHIDPNEEQPNEVTQSGLNLIDMRGIPYDDPMWSTFIDQIPHKELATMLMDGAYNTKALANIGKPATVELDGPSGINAFMGSIHGTAYTSEVVMASTFNLDLIYDFGEMIGNEALLYGVNGWYAPGMNIHRSPFAGRNFEYYSEDPLLSGKMATAVVSGAANKGLYTFIKHFVLNDQETNRVNNGISVWANEQAMREIYMKPFEMTVKDAKTTLRYHMDDDGVLDEKEISATTAIMSSFNRVGSTWAGGSSPLMENVLRGEWGFEGVAVSDFCLYEYMYANQGLANGTDYFITFISMKSLEDSTSPTAINDLKRCGHRLMYTVANSNAMNGIVPGTTVYYEMANWKKVQIAADIIILLGIAAWMIFQKRKKPNIEMVE